MNALITTHPKLNALCFQERDYEASQRQYGPALQGVHKYLQLLYCSVWAFYLEHLSESPDPHPLTPCA